MEMFASSIIKKLEVLEAGELCRVSLALPSHVNVDGVSIPLHDSMRPGTAFLLKTWGARTQKFRRRMYTRSNVAKMQPGYLETFINHTHKELSDTSIWWQSEEALIWYREERPLEVRIALDQDRRMATVYENTSVCKPTNLRLEEEGQWENMPLVCVAFGTGVTPFLAYLRYWVAHRSQIGRGNNGGTLTLVVSARHVSQLMCHDELLAVQRAFPGQFFYVPVLTRSWPTSWDGTRGRIMSVQEESGGKERIDLSNLLAVAPGLGQSHLRLCGNKLACQHIMAGLEQAGVVPRSIRSESW